MIRNRYGTVVKKILRKLNIYNQCRELGISVWYCPEFLFLLVGAVTIVSILSIYFTTAEILEPHVALSIMSVLSAILLTFGYFIVHAFELLLTSKAHENTQMNEIIKLKDHFVFVAAHELRAPANAIRWALELLETKKEELAKIDPEAFVILAQSSDRLLNLVRDLLEVSRIESKRVKLVIEKIDLSQVIIEIIHNLKELSDHFDVKIENNVPADLPHIKGDITRVREIINNVISNAIKYSGDGKIVTIASSMTKTHCEMQVIDHGMGIRQEDQAHLFEKFWRAEETPEVHGTGLGLFIVKHLVEIMHGHVRFTSKHLEGTTFYISFPKYTQNSA